MGGLLAQGYVRRLAAGAIEGVHFYPFYFSPWGQGAKHESFQGPSVCFLRIEVGQAPSPWSSALLLLYRDGDVWSMKGQSFPGVAETKDGMDLYHLTINSFCKYFCKPIMCRAFRGWGREQVRSHLCPSGTFSQLSTYYVPGPLQK